MYLFLILLTHNIPVTASLSFPNNSNNDLLESTTPSSTCATEDMLQNHHQIFNENLNDASENDIHTVAIDRFHNNNNNEEGYVFTAEYCTNTECNMNSRILVTTLNSNTPLDNPFAVDWSKTYRTTSSSNNLMVKDVKKSKDGKYILCGRYESNNESGGFLLRIQSNGNKPLLRVYTDVHVFNSVLSWNNGYFAVGTGNDDGATMLSTNLNLIPICRNSIYGKFKGQNTIRNEFKDVVKYSSTLVAMVGNTQVPFDGNENCLDGIQHSDVLYATANVKTCKFSKKKQIGGSDKNQNEFANSLAVQGKNVAIAGQIVKIKPSNQQNCPKVVYNDILLFGMNKKLKVKTRLRYDVDKSTDVGKRILWRELTKSYLIVGEARTNKFTGGGGNKGKDLFLLETNHKFNVQKFELFGGSETDAGVDLTLSSDDHAVLLGNTRSFGSTTDSSRNIFRMRNTQETSSSSTRQNAYLIERYNKVSQLCHDTTMNPKKKTVSKLKSVNAMEEKETGTIANQKIKVKVTTVNVDREIQCEKACLNPVTTLSPSAMPSVVPSSIPSSLPSGVPSDIPSNVPSKAPSITPSNVPSSVPSAVPSSIPSSLPSKVPSIIPSNVPSNVPSDIQSNVPSSLPSSLPSAISSNIPSSVPSNFPSAVPSTIPSSLPSSLPSAIPSNLPSTVPSNVPSTIPSSNPSTSSQPTTPSTPTCTTCLNGIVGHWNFDSLLNDEYTSSPDDSTIIVRGHSSALEGDQVVITGSGSLPPLIEDGKFGRGLSIPPGTQNYAVSICLYYNIHFLFNAAG